MGAYEDVKSVHIVMEFCAGGELLVRIKAKGHYSARAAASIFRAIMNFVDSCHSLCVMHRDIKPDNFLFSCKDEMARLKAIDFGLSNLHSRGETFSFFFICFMHVKGVLKAIERLLFVLNCGCLCLHYHMCSRRQKHISYINALFFLNTPWHTFQGRYMRIWFEVLTMLLLKCYGTNMEKKQTFGVQEFFCMFYSVVRHHFGQVTIFFCYF